LEALRSYAGSEGYEVVEECEDPGYSGMFLDRPGLDRARDLIEAGSVAVVLAQDADRITRKAAHRLTLDEEAARYGARWIALDDWGDDSHEGKLLRFMKGWQAEGESLKLAERSRRGARRKVSEGRLLGASPHPRYGFAYNADRTGYVIDPDTMPVVRRVFSMLADGHSIRAVAHALDDDCVPTPRGGTSWSRRTLREIALDDVYRPHTVGELAGRIPPDVLATLDPEGSYGVSFSGQVRVRKVSNAAWVREAQGPEDWIGVPVRLDRSGLDAVTVARARRLIEGNRTPRKVGDRFFELAHGPLQCAHCKRRMIAYSRPRKDGRSYHYRCDSPSRVAEPCPNRRSWPADLLEHRAARLFEETASMGTLRELFDKAVEEEIDRSKLSGSLERQAALAGMLSELEEERRGYLRQNARGVISDGDLGTLLAEVDSRREKTASELRRAEDAVATARSIEAARSSLLREPVSEDTVGVIPSDGPMFNWQPEPYGVEYYEWPSLAGRPQQLRAAYMRYGAVFEADKEGKLVLRLELDLNRYEEAEDVANRSQGHGNEHWEFDENGLMRRRDASINDYKIDESERRYRWERPGGERA
jgi:DNA invertase Pin-like site-specific DNA recombinase